MNIKHITNKLWLKKDQINGVMVDEGWYQIALKHYCGICERWFGDTRGTMMHIRHRHKEGL